MPFSNIGLHNILQPGFNALLFSLMGMALVFAGLLIIAVYILLLPKLLAIGTPKRQKSTGNEEKDQLLEEEVLLAIATALHLHNDFPEGDDRITWKSHGDMESPWLVSGRLHSLNIRKPANTWNTLK
jgi:Na+-transporting methylmalonyl-CoA/oxaloacetate decarboxylase gamma subunit